MSSEPTSDRDDAAQSATQSGSACAHTAEESDAKKKQKPLLLKDYERQVLLAMNGGFFSFIFVFLVSSLFFTILPYSNSATFVSLF